jgi:hypothetical protein
MTNPYRQATTGGAGVSDKIMAGVNAGIAISWGVAAAIISGMPLFSRLAFMWGSGFLIALAIAHLDRAMYWKRR